MLKYKTNKECMTPKHFLNDMFHLKCQSFIENIQIMHVFVLVSMSLLLPSIPLESNLIIKNIYDCPFVCNFFDEIY